MSRRRQASATPPGVSEQAVTDQAAEAVVETPPKRSGHWLLRLLKWVVGGGIVAGALVVGVLAGVWVYFHIVIDIAIRDQQVAVSLPEKLDATVEVSNILEVAMGGLITTEVPFKQTLEVPLQGTYDLDVELRAPVPLKFNVAYDGIIPIDTEADVTIRTGINYKNLKSLRNLRIKTSIPLKFPLPVNLNVPVDDVVDLEYVGPLTADVDEVLTAPVDTVLKTRLPINQTVRTPVTAALPLALYPEQGPIKAILTTLDVALKPSKMLTFGVADSDELDGPNRMDTPWGPAATGAQEPEQ